jgi:hypothetical protein
VPLRDCQRPNAVTRFSLWSRSGGLSFQITISEFCNVVFPVSPELLYTESITGVKNYQDIFSISLREGDSRGAYEEIEKFTNLFKSFFIEGDTCNRFLSFQGSLIYCINICQNFSHCFIQVSGDGTSQIDSREQFDQIGVLIKRDIMFLGDGDYFVCDGTLSGGNDYRSLVHAMLVTQGNSTPTGSIRKVFHDWKSCTVKQ